jgi:hypothetical protein
MDKRCKEDIRKVLRKFQFSKQRTVEGALEDIQECVIEYRRRKRANERKRREIEAELRKDPEMNKPYEAEKLEPLPSVSPVDLRWMYGSIL